MASPSELADQIDKSVANNFQKQISLTQQLIGFKSQRGNEAAIQKFMRHEYNARGYDTVEFDMDEAALCEHPGAGKFSGQHSRCPIVVGTYKPGTDTPTPSAVTKGRSLMLNTHVDVVPTGPEAMWKYGPYEAVVEDDWLYGRGAADMLAGASAILFALDALRDAGLRPASPVTLVSVVEEESTGNGTLMVHLKGYRADAVFIPEPEEEMLVRANVGVLWFTVKVQGVPAHVREMATGT